MTTIPVASRLAQLPLGLPFPSTGLPFLWSPHLDGVKEMVDYRTLSPRDLTKSVMTEGGWLNYLVPLHKHGFLMNNILRADEVLSQVFNFAEQLSAEYAVLYVSGPFRSVKYP